MNYENRNALRLLLLLLTALLLPASDVSGESEYECDGRRWAISIPPVPAQAIRSAIVGAVADFPDLAKIVHPDQIPPFYHIFSYGEWPRDMVPRISGNVRPAVYLGEWRVNLGYSMYPRREEFDESDIGIESVERVTTRYMIDGRIDQIECDELLLYVQRNETSDTIAKLEEPLLKVVGWALLRYRMIDHGAYFEGKGVDCIAAGGSQAQEAGRHYETTRIETARLGHIERVIDGSSDFPSAAEGEADGGG